MTNQDTLLIVSSSPHLHSPDNIPAAMRDVLIALVPALIAAVYFFRLPAVMVIGTCVASAYVAELVCLKIMKKDMATREYSAVVTGLLLAFCLPPTLPPWMAALGSVIAVVVAKHLFGGLGNNIFNPALIGRAFLLASFPVAMTSWVSPIDGVTTASPLGIMKEATGRQLPGITDMFLGNVSGSLGETSALAILIGGLYLLFRKHIDWRIPGSYLGTVFVLTSIVAAVTGQGMWFPVFHLFAGGLFLGAFFMATDWVTSPVTKMGRIIFGVGAGIFVVLIRLKGGYPEGVCYSILLMNVATPLIDRYTKARIYGGVKSHA